MQFHVGRVSHPRWAWERSTFSHSWTSSIEATSTLTAGRFERSRQSLGRHRATGIFSMQAGERRTTTLNAGLHATHVRQELAETRFSAPPLHCFAGSCAHGVTFAFVWLWGTDGSFWRRQRARSETTTRLCLLAACKSKMIIYIRTLCSLHCHLKRVSGLFRFQQESSLAQWNSFECY